MKELALWLWNAPMDQMLVLLETLFVKFFVLWLVWMVIKMMWTKMNK